MGKQYLDEVGLARVADKVKARLKAVSEMPSSADDGAVRLYIGETTTSYTKGHIYEYDSGTWTDISPAGSSSSDFDFTLIAPEFSESTNYVVGQIVTYSNGIYYCSTAHSAGTWDSSNFTELATVTELIEYLHDRDTIFITAAVDTVHTTANSAVVTATKLTGKLPKYILGRCSGGTYPYSTLNVLDSTIVLYITGSYTSATNYTIIQSGFIMPSPSPSNGSNIPGSLTDTFTNSDIIVLYHYYRNNSGTISNWGYIKLLGILTKADVGLLATGIEGTFTSSTYSGDLIAKSTYSIGDYFIFNFKLVKATAAISVGDTIAIGINCERVTITDELKSLQDALDAIPTPITPKGSIAFASLPSASSASVGDMYNITDDFTTTSDFVTSDISEAAGSNVYCIEVSGTNKWDVFAATKDFVVDQTYDATSTNAQSGVAVASAISSKQDTLTFDTTPTSGSTNPVTSGGVYDYIDTMITQALSAGY